MNKMRSAVTRVAFRYVAAIAMVANFFFMISGPWMLLIGVSADEAEPETRDR